MRALTEAGRALAMWLAVELDVAHHHPDAGRRQAADDLVALLTPVVKAACTDNGFEAANLAIGVHGGAGYITESGVEQLARDARISQIYEGTNGVQALDLVGRKLGLHHGRLLRRFFHPAAARAAGPHPAELQELAEPVAEALAHLQETTVWLMSAGRDREQAAAAATDYLRLFALTAFADLELRMAAACLGDCRRRGRVRRPQARHRPLLLRPRAARDRRPRPGGARRQGLRSRPSATTRSDAQEATSRDPRKPSPARRHPRRRRWPSSCSPAPPRAASGRRWSTRPRAARSPTPSSTRSSRGCAAGLQRRGLEPGQVVGIFAPNVPEYAVAFLGVALAGGTNTTINGLYTEARDRPPAAELAGARFLFTVPALLDRALPAAAAAGVESVFSFDGGEGTIGARRHARRGRRAAACRRSTRRRRSSRCPTRAARPACRRA